MASLYPRGNLWWVTWIPPGRPRKRKSTGFTVDPDQRLQAEEVCARFALLERQARELLPRTLTFGQVIAKFLKAKAGEVEAKTLAGYQTHVNNFRETTENPERPASIGGRAILPDSRPFEAVTAEHIRAYLAARVAAGAAPSTANKERMSLLALWNWAQANEFTERNPVKAVKPRPIRGRPRRQPYPVLALLDLLATLRAEAINTRAAIPSGSVPPVGDRLRRHAHDCELVADLAEVFYWTGWRLGEGCALRPADVDLERAAIPITSAANKGGEAETPILPPVVAVLKRRAALGGKFLFGAFDGKRNGRAAVEKFWQRWSDPEQHPENARFADFTFHRLRHSYTTDLERSGEKGTVARGLTRHRSIQAHAVYLHAGAEELRAAQERLATWRQLELERAMAEQERRQVRQTLPRTPGA